MHKLGVDEEKYSLLTVATEFEEIFIIVGGPTQALKKTEKLCVTEF